MRESSRSAGSESSELVSALKRMIAHGATEEYRQVAAIIYNWNLRQSGESASLP